MTRIAVVGAGRMARVRTGALLATGQVQVCAVATRHAASAGEFAEEIGCPNAYDDFRRIAEARPDAVLVEVPHEAQDRIVTWALEQGLHVLVGGSLAGTPETAESICELSSRGNLVVEAGYEARYSAPWEKARALLADGAIGRLTAVRSIALWPGDPESWYYSQQASGGMPVTHMTYCFLNPVRWLAGRPVAVSAFANRKKHTAPDLVREEMCVANVLFEGDVLYSLTAGYVAPPTMPAWSVTLVGTDGAIELVPPEETSGHLRLYGADTVEDTDFSDAPDPFRRQADAFLTDLSGGSDRRNPPEDCQWDVRLAAAIAKSAQARRTIAL